MIETARLAAIIGCKESEVEDYLERLSKAAEAGSKAGIMTRDIFFFLSQVGFSLEDIQKSFHEVVKLIDDGKEVGRACDIVSDRFYGEEP